jgi:hypothetical protein
LNNSGTALSAKSLSRWVDMVLFCGSILMRYIYGKTVTRNLLFVCLVSTLFCESILYCTQQNTGGHTSTNEHGQTWTNTSTNEHQRTRTNMDKHKRTRAQTNTDKRRQTWRQAPRYGMVHQGEVPMVMKRMSMVSTWTRSQWWSTTIYGVV